MRFPNASIISFPHGDILCAHLLYMVYPYLRVNNYVTHVVGIIPSKHVAGVVRDGKFSGQLINSDTQIVFMDEWSSDSLSAEDAKRILQGIFNISKLP